jgi:hypothetical protein
VLPGRDCTLEAMRTQASANFMFSLVVFVEKQVSSSHAINFQAEYYAPAHLLAFMTFFQL